MTPESEYRLFIEPHMDNMWKEICFRVKNESDRVDILQEVRIKAFKNLGKYNPDNVTGWLITMTRNLIHDYRRYNSKRWKTVWDLELLCTVNATLYHDSFQEESYFLAKEDHALNVVDYKEIVKGLNPLYRNVIELYVFDRNNETEIAEQLCLPLATVKNHIFRGRNEFKKALDNVAR